MTLVPGDVVYVPEQLEKVSVVGQVKQPGSISWNDHLTVLEAIQQSGGITDMATADLKGAKLTHNGVEKPLDLDAMLKHGDMTANIDLAPNDRISIPELNNRVYVYGDVARPGFYPFKENDHVQDALGYAGLAPDADTKKINLIHVNSAKTEAHLVVVNLADFQQLGHSNGNPPVQPGDSLYIPKQHVPFSFRDILTPIQAVGTVAYTTRLVGGL